MKLDHYLTPYIKVNSKWITYLNVSPENVKVLEGSIGEKLLNICLGDNFFRYDPKYTCKRSENRQVGLHETEKLLHNKGNDCQSEETSYRIGENTGWGKTRFTVVTRQNTEFILI